MWFLNWHAKENLVVNNKDNRVLMSRNYRSAPWKFDVLKASIFLRTFTSNFRGIGISSVFVESGIKIFNVFEIRDQNFGEKYGISNEKIYLVSTLKRRETLHDDPNND